ncbi:MAG: S-adenosyl-l-methionine hydroxide adenosyltransferase family protein [Caldimicrobium sp.]
MSSYPFNLSRVVALLTDFGYKDHYVGVVKGRILKEIKKEYPIFVDITHEIAPQDIKRAALYLNFSYHYFPSGTIFLVVVDPEVGTEKKAILFTYSSTFHARDLFAICVAKLLNQEPLEDWTKPVCKDELKLIPFPEPAVIPGGYKLSIWLIDHFGNLITNFSKDLIQAPFEVWVNNRKVRLVKTYAEGNDKVAATFSMLRT